MSRVTFKLPEVIELKLRNPWLALYAYNITKSPFHFDIPSMWLPDGPFIASGRLDLYDGGVVALEPEMDLITFFLSYPSSSIARRALHHYLRLEENTLASGDTQHLRAISPKIFCKGLSTDENRVTWLLLVDVLLPSFGSMSLQENGYFVEAFLGYRSLRENNQANQHQSMMYFKGRR